jgi:hypothetical protein
MKANQIKPGDRFLDSETGVVYRVEQVQPPTEGYVTVIVRYTEQNLTRTFTWETDAEVNITERGKP